MARDSGEREVVYVEREGSSLRPIVLGALLGLAVGILFAPQSGEDTRRALRKRLQKVRALAEDKVGELSEKMGGEWRRPEGREGRGDEVRADLERRLAEARARRRAAAPVASDDDEDEEPVA